MKRGYMQMLFLSGTSPREHFNSEAEAKPNVNKARARSLIQIYIKISILFPKKGLNDNILII